MKLVHSIPVVLALCLVAILLVRWEAPQEDPLLPPRLPTAVMSTPSSSVTRPNAELSAGTPVFPQQPSAIPDLLSRLLRPREQCAGFVAGRPSNAGFADSHTKRDNAMLAVLHLLDRNACYVHQPLGKNRHEAAPLDFDELVGFRRGWLGPPDVAGLRRELVPAKSLPEFLRHVEARGMRRDVVYVIPDFTVEDHCPSAPVWRQKYFAAAGNNGPTTRFYLPDCWRVALHMRGADARKHKERVVSMSYFVHVLQQVGQLTQGHQLCVHLFTDDDSPDHALPLRTAAPALRAHPKGDANAAETFHHLVMADVLVISKSGFSHLAGMVSRGIKFAMPFWHSTNCDRWWISTSETGRFNETHFSLLWKEMLDTGKNV